MNSKHSKTNESNKFIYEFTDQLDPKNANKNIALAKLSIYYAWKNIKSVYNNNNFKISAPTWNYELDLSDGSYSISDIPDYFEYIIKKHETVADDLPLQIYINKIKNRVVFQIKTGYKLALLSKETMKLLGSTEKFIDKDKNGENVPKLEIVHVILMHCNVVNNSYQQASKVLFTFVPDKQFGQLITIAPDSLTMIKTTNAEFQSIEVWLTDRNNRPFEIENNVNITLIIETGYFKSDIQLNQEKENMLKDMTFCHLQENLEINMAKT